MDVVLYMRYSSERQTEQSIEGQRRVCTEFCKRMGYNIVDSYIDRATSAFKDTSKRTSFQKMIRDSEKHLWEAVVVYKLDRFARNRYDSATYKAKLKKSGVRVISATEQISENPEGVILEAVLEGMAEFYSKELSQKVTRGMRETALKCNSIGGHIPFGYKIENKKLVIVEPQATIVREAFALYAGGASVARICEDFKDKGYKNSKGEAFTRSSFDRMFRNERYIGVYKYKDVRIENGVPTIIDKATWNKVQKRLKINAQSPSRGKAKVDYLLTQKLFCGHCGAPMVGESGTGRSKVYNYYTCTSRKRQHNCDKTPLKKDFIERAVVQDVVSLLTPEYIEKLADAAVRQNQLDIKNTTLVPSLQAELHDIKKSISNLLKLVEKGAESDALSDRLNDLERQKRDTEVRLLEAQDDVIVLEREHVVWWLSQFIGGDIDSEDFRRHVIDLLVNSVTVWDEPDGWFKITIACNLTDNPPHTYRIQSGNGSDISNIGSPMHILGNSVNTLFPSFVFTGNQTFDTSLRIFSLKP